MLCSKCSETIRPVVGIDIDGTLARYHEHFFNFAAQWLGADPHILNLWLEYNGGLDIATWMDIDKRTYRQIKLAYRQGGMKRCMPIFLFARYFMRELANMGLDVWITTTRPYLQVGNVDDDTREWLRRHELPYDHIIYEDDKYGDLLRQVDKARVLCVLDDQLEDHNRAVELGIPALFHVTNWNIASRPDFATGVDLQEALAVIKNMHRNWMERHAAT